MTARISLAGMLCRLQLKLRLTQQVIRLVSGLVHAGCVVTIEDARAIASQLPRAYEALVRDRVKFRVGRIVFLAFSRDEQTMGFGFPKEEREALVASEPGKFLMPGKSDLRYHWVHVRLSAIDRDELEELILDAWRMVVPKSVAAAYLSSPARLGPARST
jgi:hypothetical protein